MFLGAIPALQTTFYAFTTYAIDQNTICCGIDLDRLNRVDLCVKHRSTFAGLPADEGLAL